MLYCKANEERLLMVEIYRNLHRDCFSVREKGKVICHTDFCILKNVTFVVQPAGRRKVLRTKQKCVHAFVKGELVEDWGELPKMAFVTYNPYLYSSFVLEYDKQPIYYSDMAMCVKHQGKFLVLGTI